MINVAFKGFSRNVGGRRGLGVLAVETGVGGGDDAGVTEGHQCFGLWHLELPDGVPATGRDVPGPPC